MKITLVILFFSIECIAILGYAYFIILDGHMKDAQKLQLYYSFAYKYASNEYWRQEGVKQGILDPYSYSH